LTVMSIFSLISEVILSEVNKAAIHYTILILKQHCFFLTASCQLPAAS